MAADVVLGLPGSAWRLVFELAGWQEDLGQLATFRLVSKDAAAFALTFVRQLKVRLLPHDRPCPLPGVLLSYFTEDRDLHRRCWTCPPHHQRSAASPHPMHVHAEALCVVCVAALHMLFLDRA